MGDREPEQPLLPKYRLRCAPRPNRSTETGILEEEKDGFIFCQAEGKTQQASASRIVPSLLGNQGRFYMWGLQSGV